ncbi:uncharacterized protein BDR25DRAFT_343465 [Lindgomyces ingoldianus]|uniref:Uncharacterized protein n=1 Tax=Lindgomyces ingoldianus TaxID=673940 RepID=A0ACB6QUB2_9PLEO|nr:uncharacterized protein BDR25DRAFT_343465 [Lindgomyces ingoldianus]KAF2469761.1 hypothetical protein BDR25DRAFT_343465 [Lindgomyces ingoldianus]
MFPMDRRFHRAIQDAPKSKIMDQSSPQKDNVLVLRRRPQSFDSASDSEEDYWVQTNISHAKERLRKQAAEDPFSAPRHSYTFPGPSGNYHSGWDSRRRRDTHFAQNYVPQSKREFSKKHYSDAYENDRCKNKNLSYQDEQDEYSQPEGDRPLFRTPEEYKAEIDKLHHQLNERNRESRQPRRSYSSSTQGLDDPRIDGFQRRATHPESSSDARGMTLIQREIVYSSRRELAIEGERVKRAARSLFPSTELYTSVLPDGQFRFVAGIFDDPLKRNAIEYSLVECTSFEKPTEAMHELLNIVKEEVEDWNRREEKRERERKERPSKALRNLCRGEW